MRLNASPSRGRSPQPRPAQDPIALLRAGHARCARAGCRRPGLAEALHPGRRGRRTACWARCPLARRGRNEGRLWLLRMGKRRCQFHASHSVAHPIRPCQGKDKDIDSYSAFWDNERNSQTECVPGPGPGSFFLVFVFVLHGPCCRSLDSLLSPLRLPRLPTPPAAHHKKSPSHLTLPGDLIQTFPNFVRQQRGGCPHLRCGLRLRCWPNGARRGRIR